VVVEEKEALEGAIQGSEGGEEAPTEGDSPVFVEDGALEALDEAVGPTVTRLGAGVVDGELGADLVEKASKFISLVCEDALEFPTGFPVGRQQDASEESGTVDGFGRGDDLGHGIGACGVAGRDLPELAHALEPADVEAIQTNQFTGDLRFDVAGTAISSAPEG